MKINVRREDIRDGMRMRTTECMVALALKRELGVEYASVGLRDARIKVDDRMMTLRLPKAVSRKIRFWELFHFVLPFSFECPGLALSRGQAACAMPWHQTPLLTTLPSFGIA